MYKSIYWAFKPTVGVFVYLSVSSVAASMPLPFELKQNWVLFLIEWIEMIYFKFTLVDFIAGQLKFK